MTLRSTIKHAAATFERDFETYNNITISRSAILHNFDLFRSLSKGKLLIPVLKSNAYGHGLEQVASILKDRTMPYIAVDGYYEAERIHQVSKQPVLVMGAILPQNYKNIEPRQNAFVIHQTEIIHAMGKTGKHFKVHIELETGMGRHGVRLDELDEFLAQLQRYANLHVEGVMTHLADADNPTSTAHPILQTTRFDKAVQQMQKAGFSPSYIHIAQSAGSVKVKSKFANTLRIGIGLYGISPLTDEDKAAPKLDKLIPALTLTSKIGKVLTIDRGESVSYGCTYTARRKSRIGVLPLGYYEGLPRALSTVGVVKLADGYASIAGRVCMNHTMIDITDSTATLGDEVVIFSALVGDPNSVANICRTFDIFNYGLLVGINLNIRRTIVA